MRRSVGSRVVAFASTLLVLLLAPAEPARAVITISEFPVASQLGPGPITGGSDGYVWFAEPGDDTIGRINPTGVVTEYPLPTPYQEPRGIAAGPGGTVWFTETGGHTGAEGIGMIDPSGTITEFPLPANSRPYGITMGPDGTSGSRNYRSSRSPRSLHRARSPSSRR